VMLSSAFTLHPPPESPLFPYTTLFRSPPISGSILRPHLLSRRYLAGLLRHLHLSCELDRLSLPPASMPESQHRRPGTHRPFQGRSEEHTSELQSPDHLVCRLLLETTKH